MEQILQSTYLNDPDKWQTEANRLGGLEICDDDTFANYFETLEKLHKKFFPTWHKVNAKLVIE